MNTVPSCISDIPPTPRLRSSDTGVAQLDPATATLPSFTATTGMTDRSAAEYALSSAKKMISLHRMKELAQSHTAGEMAAKLGNENFGILHDFAPKTASEGLLCRQILSTDQILVSLGMQLLHSGDGPLHERLVRQYEMFSRLMIRQIDMLRKLQKPDQRIEVQRVTINGGQAVIGTVTPGGPSASAS